MSTAPVVKPRLASLDQFRGYTVAGMFLVNFLGAYHDWVPAVLLHHHTYCSYADTIMPHFLFAVGFAMRLSFGRRVQTQGLAAGYLRMVRRILGLFLVSMVIYTAGRISNDWHGLVERGMWDVTYPYLKRHWLETLGQIAFTSLWILPVIRSGFGPRIALAVFSGAAHIALSHWFHYHWVNTDPNGIDGGPLGFLTWSIPAIVGTMACDVVIDATKRPPLLRMTLAAFLIMGLGYVFSCGTRLYDLSPAELARYKENRRTQDEQKKVLSAQMDALRKKVADHNAAIKKLDDQIAEARRVKLKALVDPALAKAENAERPRREVINEAEKQLASQPADPAIAKLEAERGKLKQQDSQFAEFETEAAAIRIKLRGFRDVKLAASPVIPPQEAWRGRTWKTLLAEPPFVQPPMDDARVDAPPYEMQRYWNYWMMTQRGGSLSYLTFGAGFSLLVYVFFYILSDMMGIRIGVFRTFGTNALAAYVLAGMIGEAVKNFIPNDAPPWYTITGFCVDFFLIWLFCRTLEKNNIFLRV